MRSHASKWRVGLVAARNKEEKSSRVCQLLTDWCIIETSRSTSRVWFVVNLLYTSRGYVILLCLKSCKLLSIIKSYLSIIVFDPVLTSMVECPNIDMIAINIQRIRPDMFPVHIAIVYIHDPQAIHIDFWSRKAVICSRCMRMSRNPETHLRIGHEQIMQLIDRLSHGRFLVHRVVIVQQRPHEWSMEEYQRRLRVLCQIVL